MHELAGWENISVKQKDLVWGCIPAGYEWMIRFAQVKIIKLDCFQENCLLDVIKAEKSLDFNFKTIAEAIIKRNPNLDIQIYMNGKEHVDTNFRSVNHAKKKQYPTLKIHIKNDFKNGGDKFSCIERLIERQKPCLLSTQRICKENMKKCVDYRINLYTLANEPQINIQCHIRPVIKIENVRLYLREYNESEPVLYKRLEIEDYHGRFNRCVDIAWLDVK